MRRHTTRFAFPRGLLATTLVMQVVAAVAIALLSSAQSVAQDALPGMPEAFAIEDITHLGCEIETIEYARGGAGTGESEEPPFQEPISRTVEPCPPGTVLHKFPTTIAEAERLGLPYVVLSGDEAIDRAAVQELQQTLLPPAPVATAVNAKRALPAAAACTYVYKSRSVNYWAGGTGAGVTSRAYYLRETDCVWYLYSSSEALFDDLSPGEDLYWDEVYYQSGGGWQWDAGCQPMAMYDTDWVYFYYAWWINIGYLYSDESINSTSAGCSWWGEEYVGSVYLT